MRGGKHEQKVVHYINQFFAGIVARKKLTINRSKEGVVGPGIGLNAALGDEAEIVATVIL